jgi:hypothetical protein
MDFLSFMASPHLGEYTMGDPLHENLCRVLSLDGGGAKGFYTLGRRSTTSR